MKKFILSIVFITFCCFAHLYAYNSFVDSDVLSGGVISGNDTICYQTSPGLLTSVSGASGCAGSTTYQWQDSVPGGNWNTILNASSETYQPISLTATTYYRRIASNDACAQVAYSNVVCVVVRNQIAAPVIAQYSDTVCYNAVPNQLSITTPSMAGIGDSITYQWQNSLDSSNWSDISNATGLSYQSSAITQNQYYRVVASSNKGCGTFISNSVKINVYPELSLSVTGCAPLCYMASGMLSVSATGAGDRYTYQWQVLTSGQWDNVGSNSSQFTTPAKPSGDYDYRCIVTPLSGCQSDTSSIMTVKVYDDLSAGSIFNDDTICNNVQPNIIQSVTSALGCDSVFVYQWEYSLDSINWNTIVGENSLTFQPSILTESTYYRRKVSNSECAVDAYSNVVKIEVIQQINSPVVALYSDTVCYNTVPNLLTIDTPSVAGVDEVIEYQWQDSLSNGSWTDIQDATELFYQPSALTQTHYYRVVASSAKNCGTVISNEIEVNVYPELQVSASGCAPICYMTNGVISVSATGAGGRYNYQWQVYVSGQWSSVGSDNSQFTTPSKPEGNYDYRCIVTPLSGCKPDTTQIITVQVYSDLNAGIISEQDTVCYNAQPGIIQSILPASGCDSILVYQWEQSVDNINWTSISNANSLTYQPSALTQTTYYRRKVSNVRCGVSAYSNVAVISVKGQMTAPVVGQYLDTICYNSVPEELEVTTMSIPEMGDTIYYQWQESVDGQSWNDIPNATLLTYQPSALTADHYYRVMAISSDGCGARSSNTIKINVYDEMIIINNPVDTICPMTPITLTFTATGKGGEYSYQWQESSDSINFTNIEDQKRSDYSTDDKPEGKYYYRCIVMPRNGCPADTSDVFVVNVYEKLRPGKIGSNQVVCKNEDASELGFVTPPSGGATNRYNYQWEYSVDSINWNNLANETSASYTPRNIQQTTFYRVKVSNSCGLEYTNTVKVLVNPLPDTVIISGNQNVCLNKYEYYSIPEISSGFDYQWSIDDISVGEIVTNPLNETLIRVLWLSANSSANVILTIKNNETGCLSESYYPVKVASEITPDTTIVIRKPNSNILICQDSISDHYQWGTTERSTGIEIKFEDCDRRYCQVESGIDTINYIYWLDLWNGDTARCVSRSIYTPSNDDKYIHKPKQSINVVSKIDDCISFEVENPLCKEVSVSLYTIAGTKLVDKFFGNSAIIKADLPVDIPSGVYILRVEIGTDCETFKLIAE